MLRETGFFSDTAIEVGGVKVKPIDLTSKLLFPNERVRKKKCIL
jgi:saccharopine dehydrogenase-like NADP-dependent oxidoreductase